MPYRIGRSDSCPASKPWAVIGPNGVKGCHETREGAARQMAALYANEPGLAEFETISVGTLLVEYPGQPRDTRGRFGTGGLGALSARVGQETAARGGGTYEPTGLVRIEHGAVVARPGHSQSFDAERFKSDAAYREQAIGAYLRDEQASFRAGGKVGVWDSTAEGGSTVVLDVVDVTDRATAIRLGRERGEDGVYDLDGNDGAGEYIPTGGSTYTPSG